MSSAAGAGWASASDERSAQGPRRVPALVQVLGTLLVVNLLGGAYLYRVHEDQPEPARVTTATLSDVVDVDVDGAYSCTVGASGGVRCWGDPPFEQPTADPGVAESIPIYTDPIGVATGETFLCILDDHGDVSCRGRNDVGQLGTSEVSSAGWFPIEGIEDATSVTAGGHGCALVAADPTLAGEVRCWGLNHHGQLADGTRTDRAAPVTVSGIGPAVAVSAGAAHTCAVTEDGQVWCWGANGSGQLGDGTTEDRLAPVPVAGLDRVTSVSAGTAHSCALTEDGRAWCWGANAGGQLGDGTTRASLVPVPVAGLDGVVEVAAGRAAGCAIAGVERAVSCWGTYGTGLDPSARDPFLVPTAIAGVAGVDEVAVSGHACALEGGGVLCWGADTWLLGRGSLEIDDDPDRFGPAGAPMPVVRVVPPGEEP